MTTTHRKEGNSRPAVMGKNLGGYLELEPKELTSTNSEGLAAIELTDEQKYHFDTQGMLVIPAVLDAHEVAEMREFCCQLHRHPESIPEPERCAMGGPLQRLVDHPIVLGFMNEFVAYPYLATEHGYGFRMESNSLHLRSKGTGRFGPHNGSGMLRFPGDSHTYRVFPGRAYSGLTRVVWELNPVEKGGGGTLFLKGSHKAAFPVPESVVTDPDSPLWDDYECPQGSVLFFTEAITHTGAPWNNPERDRVAVFSCYNTVNERWHNWEPDPDLLASMPPKRQTLFRPVYVNGNQVTEEGS